jgi:hypothetical protein
MRGTQTNPAETGLPDETPADRVPPVQGELGLRLSLADNLEVEGFVVARTAQRRLNDPINIDDNRIPEGGTPGYATFHARVKYRPNPAVLTRLSFAGSRSTMAAASIGLASVSPQASSSPWRAGTGGELKEGAYSRVAAPPRLTSGRHPPCCAGAGNFGRHGVCDENEHGFDR